jgi:hypothetical protein
MGEKGDTSSLSITSSAHAATCIANHRMSSDNRICCHSTADYTPSDTLFPED